MKIYGYVRVSSADQNEDRQLMAMKELGIPPNRIYMDKQSGKDFERIGYKNNENQKKKRCATVNSSNLPVNAAFFVVCLFSKRTNNSGYKRGNARTKRSPARENNGTKGNCSSHNTVFHSRMRHYGLICDDLNTGDHCHGQKMAIRFIGGS